MEITIVRIYFDNVQTIGALQVNGKYFCDTLECRAIDWEKEKKDPGKTAIPEGLFPMKMKYNSDVRKNVMVLENVPHYHDVMIMGKRESLKNRGHIMLGKMDGDELTDSNHYVKKLMKMCQEANNNEPINVKVRSRFGWTTPQKV